MILKDPLLQNVWIVTYKLFASNLFLIALNNYIRISSSVKHAVFVTQLKKSISVKNMRN